jgi:hypothetical protein
MTTGSVLLGSALFLLVALLLAKPFLARPDKQRRMTRRQDLLVRKEVYLDQIRSLDFDYETGKMPEDVYQRQRAHLLSEASHILKQLDEIQGRPSPAGVGDEMAARDTEIENAIARLRQSAAGSGPSNGQKSFCSQCGKPIDPEDRFCAHCGQKQAARQPVQS